MAISLDRKIENSENYTLPDGEIGMFTTDGGKNAEMVMPSKDRPTTGLSLIICGIFMRLMSEEQFSREMLRYVSDHLEEMEETFGMDIDADLLRHSINPN